MVISEKILFIDKIVTLFGRFCPDMYPQVRYWVACQFALESNFGTSNRAKNDHNLCGMKIPKVRFSFNTAASGDFAKYNSDEECILDYLLWLSYNRFSTLQFKNLDLFRLHLKFCGYCPDADYIDNINSLFNQLNS